ncbi:MAG: putative zinc-binding metallopeptidase [Myxococcaceae bacterium]|nr:putative zinc-binding metallopeptidase [Myxococcaceae bacterium]
MASASPIAFREKNPAELREHPDGAGISPDREGLLRSRIKDLQLHIPGTPLEKFIHQLHAELEAKGISFKPQCYLSDQWGCPSGVPVIGIPFYLADPKLLSIEAELGDAAETEEEILMYLRHEAGHAINYAYKLYETEEWQKLFGDYNKPYKEEYKPRPFSRKYVVHISGWYAQKHPDEDFAESFAVWLTPGIDWQKRYHGWGALKKLQYVDQVMQKVGRTPPLVQLDERDAAVEDMEETVLDHYRARQLAEKVDVQLHEHLDQDLFDLFEPPGQAQASAEMFIRAERSFLIEAVAHYSGVSRAVVRSLVDHLQGRCAHLKLTVKIDNAREYMTRLTSLLTALAMNYLYTDRFFDLD